jgi:hypothetical protein
MKGEEVREGGGRRVEALHVASVHWVAHCTCKLTASRFDRSLPFERRRGGRRRSGRRFFCKEKKERCHLVASI